MYIYIYMYLIAWKQVCEYRFHDVLQWQSMNKWIKLQRISKYNISHHRDIYCVLIHHTSSSIMLTNQNFFLYNDMIMIICSLVKIFHTHTPTHTHTHTYRYKHTHEYNFFLTRSNCCDFHFTSRFKYPGDSLIFTKRRMRLTHTNTKYPLYVRTQ